jgi:hypothetical protein
LQWWAALFIYKCGEDPTASHVVEPAVIFLPMVDYVRQTDAITDEIWEGRAGMTSEYLAL